MAQIMELHIHMGYFFSVMTIVSFVLFLVYYGKVQCS